jgi:hypothetical protein
VRSGLRGTCATPLGTLARTMPATFLVATMATTHEQSGVVARLARYAVDVTAHRLAFQLRHKFARSARGPAAVYGASLASTSLSAPVEDEDEADDEARLEGLGAAACGGPAGHTASSTA